MSRRRLVGLLTAQTISMVGSRMSMLALPWFVLTTTGSAARAGITAFAEMLPYVLACALGGPLIDRLGARRVSIAADLASAASMGAIPLLHAGGLTYPGLVAIVTVTGALRGFGDMGKRAMLPRVAVASGVDLTRAASLQDGLTRLATLLGAPAGGVLVAVLDAPAVLAIDAASFALAGLLVAALVGAMPPVDSQREPYLRSLASGARFLRRDRLIAGTVVMLAFTNLFDAAYSSVLLPVWAAQVAGSPVVLGFTSAAFGIGAVLGNLAFTAVAPRAPRFALFAYGFVVGGGPRFLAVALTDEAWIVYGVSFIAGLGLAAVNPILGAVSYERIPESMLARVQGLTTAAAWTGIPLGGLLGGWLTEAVGLRPALLGFGVAYLLVTLAPFAWRATWRQLDDRPPAGQAGSAGRGPQADEPVVAVDGER